MSRRDGFIDGTDVEGHRMLNQGDSEPLMPRLPSTGGDLTDRDDVEGHRQA